MIGYAHIRIIDSLSKHIDLDISVDTIKKDDLFYKDTLGNEYHIKVNDKGLIINLTSLDHQTYLNLYDNPNAKIISSLGELNLPVKVLAFNYKDDIVCMQYSVDETIKEIIIEYGEK